MVFGLVNPAAGVSLGLVFGVETLNVGTNRSVTLSLTATGGSVTYNSATVANLFGQNSFSKGADTCTGTVQPVGGVCTVTINFAPALFRFGTLTVSDTGTGSPQTVVLMSF